jgi:hypothetical protein
MCESIKTIIWPTSHKKESVAKLRIITQDKRWTFLPEDLTPTAQLDLAKMLLLDDAVNVIAMRMLSDKLRGYRAQDTHKELYSESEFIPMRTLIDVLVRCNLTCFYCKEPVKLLYEAVRDPKQWTLERIDNTRGHNSDNVEIACLTCNLRRRTMYHERYVLTKQMCQVVKST